MEGTVVSAPPQRVCPKCARISWATGPRCPYCRSRFRRQNAALIAWMIAAGVVVVLLGVLAIMLVVENRVESHFDNQISQQFDSIRKEVDTRLSAIPSVTPFPTPAPTAAPTTTPAPTATPSATVSPSATASPTATATTSSKATPTPTTIIGP
jgi:hypothetical protein